MPVIIEFSRCKSTYSSAKFELIIVLLAVIIAYAFLFFVKNPMEIGAKRFFIEATYQEKHMSDFGKVVFVFAKGRYMNCVKVLFFRDLYIGLWSLLFLIPGIVKSYEYRMLPYILAENPTIDRQTAFRLSREMMEGEKWNAFVLDLSFILWYLLIFVTCGLVGIFYVNPYIYMTSTQLYETLKHRATVDYYDKSLSGFEYHYEY